MSKVLVFGLGLNGGGVGSAKFFATHGYEVKVTDLKSAETLKPSLDQLKDFPIEYTLGEHKEEDIGWADLIIKNPGVKPGNKFIEYAKSKDKRVEQDMGIFLEYVKPSQIIGITGTKGKSTTASLIYEVLKAEGKNVILAGNIGKSVLDIITMLQNSVLPPQGWKANKNSPLIVLELSSFQLEAFDQHQVSPKYAVITNIYPDHLNYYQNMDEYIAAKKVIGLYQNPDDFLFINKDNPTISNPKFLAGFKGQEIFYSTSDLPQNFKPVLEGEHNKSNMVAALTVGKVFNIDESTILQTLSGFSGVPFRMELIKTWQGVKIINDTTATGPDAAIQSIRTYPNCILICGGMNKGMDYTEFAKVVSENVKAVFFLEGDSSNEILSLLKRTSTPGVEPQIHVHGPYNDLEKLLSDVKEVVKNRDVILFSPAATSFNLFQNEFDRGRKFNKAVQQVFQ